MKEFEQDKDYQEIHEKYQAMAKEQPPQSLDASIVQAAHLAVENSTVEKTADNKPGVNKTAVNKSAVNKPVVNKQGLNQAGIDTQSVKRAWYVPVSYVAILVISLSVVMKLALEPEMTPMLDENQLLERSEDYSTAVEQDVTAPLTTLAQLPPAKRKLAKSAPARVKQEVSGTEETHQQGLNELQRTVQERQVSMDNVARDNVTRDNVTRAKIIKEQKNDEARSGKMLSLSQIETVKDEPATVAPVVTVMIEPAAQMSMAANSGSSIMSGITSEKAFTDEPSVVGALKENESKKITLKQKSEVKELVDLYEKKQFKELKLGLYNYRKNYPAGEKPEALPEMLLDWEKEHISQSKKK